MTVQIQRRYRVPVALSIVLLVGIWYSLRLSDIHVTSLPRFDILSAGSRTESLDFFDRARKELSLDLTPSVRYSQRCIRPDFLSSVNRNNVANISQSLVGKQATVRLPGQQPAKLDQELPECTPINLTVPHAYPATEKFPHLIFGVATKHERLNDSLESIAHWAANRQCKLVAIVDDYETQGADRVFQLQDEYRKSGVEATFVKPLNDSHMTSQLHFMVLTAMVEESDPKTEWFGFIDDDTFFPHLKPLSNALGKLDHTTDIYVGALAEDFQSVKNFGIMAYGGAGAYLSARLARKLGAPSIAEQCVQIEPIGFGDILISHCVYRYSRAKLTSLPGLYQHDFTGNPSGFFESGAEALNFHHWKSWYHEPVTKMAAATNFCGNCFLQRWRFGSDTVFSNGYSISLYRSGVAHLELDKMEHTFDKIYEDSDPHYEFTIGPLRDEVAQGEKKSYHLVDTEIRDGTMRQLYIWKGDGEGGELDEVIELVWIR